MKVILIEKVPSLGNVGEIVNVKPGHARNFLIPNRKAVIADQSNQAQQKHMDKMLAQKVAVEREAAESIKGKLDGLSLVLIKKVGTSGKLFGTVTTHELARELATKDIEVERRLLTLSQPIKALGTYSVKAKLFKGVEADFSVKVEIDPQQAEELKKKALTANKKKKEMEAKAKEEKEKQEASASSSESPQEELTEEQKLAKEAAEILKN